VRVSSEAEPAGQMDGCFFFGRSSASMYVEKERRREGEKERRREREKEKERRRVRVEKSRE
jgi:hypothetical protein